MFDYGKEIPLGDVVSSEPALMKDANKISPSEFPYDYGKHIFIPAEEQE